MASSSSPSSPIIVKKRAGVPLFSLPWLAMAVLFLFIATNRCAAIPYFPSTDAKPDKLNGVTEGNRFYCFRGFKRCMSGSIKQCIKPEQECDGVMDCADGSDEGNHCESFNCSAVDRYTCPSGRMCMMNATISDSGSRGRYTTYVDAYSMSQYPLLLCDGVKDCADGSDEDPRFCASYDCKSDGSVRPLPRSTSAYLQRPVHRWPCPGGKGGCVSGRQLCDGVVDCVGGSDEREDDCKKRGCSPSSPLELFQCPSGRCIDRELACDGKKDCADGGDEGEFCEKMACAAGRVKCEGGGNRTCILESQVCDGVEDCPGGTDEKQCDTSPPPCTFHVTSLCPSGKVCASFYSCDGVTECSDGSDEDPTYCRTQNCSSDQVRCEDGLTCIRRLSLCDGVKNCPDASDEDPVFCREQRNCTSDNMAKCPGSEYVWCANLWSLCDGIPGDCYGDDDEKPDFCASEETRLLLGQDWRISCRSNLTLYIHGDYCDGKEDCMDGSDESEDFCTQWKCPYGKVKCYGKWCFRGWRCDGTLDCPDGSDEQGCTA